MTLYGLPIAFWVVGWTLAIVCDIKSREIPNAAPVLLLMTGVIQVVLGKVALLESILGLLPGILLLIACLFGFDVCGGGDIKLIAAAGTVTGFIVGTLAMSAGLLTMLLYALLTLAITKEKKKSIPAAPFLAIGFLPVGVLILM